MQNQDYMTSNPLAQGQAGISGIGRANTLAEFGQRAQEAAYRQQAAASNDIKEPAVYGRAEETLKFICEALNVAGQISCRVAGPRPESDEDSAKECELSLDRVLAISSQRAVCLVSMLRTIREKIG